MGENLAINFYDNFYSSEKGVVRLYEEAVNLIRKQILNRDEKECHRDVQIDYINEKRGISLELSKEEKLLYSYSQGITLKQLEQIRDSES